ncbi:Spy/CpxP family protein refolding chaperone [Halomonas saccharevitans]|uniref:Spy/CpxP family protein refolding chaperone n=1 Tax=Halomonas saccharevitans TaxID=416872 RepID=A0ABU3NDJ1_9GAMM|nr:Spy/CpxP family protein refolding chaperone [Halomonas saccharevitans]MDT8879250.1 Spy/CpxP family protein refolding chaperone [Halomonas saccharevitans]
MVRYQHVIAIALAAGLGIAASGAASAHGTHQGQHGAGGMMGYGHQGGMGPGMMGYGQQGGMGPGMMGYGHQGGMGPGMMGYGQQGGMGPGMMGYGMMQVLELEPDQRREMRELMQQHRPAQFDRMGQMMDLRMALMEEMHAEAPDPDEVKSLHDQMAELQGAMMADRVRLHNQMQDLLTDEQREQLKQRASGRQRQP